MAKTSAAKKKTSAANAKKPAAKNTKKTVPATSDDIMKFLEASDKKADANVQMVAGSQVKIVSLIREGLEALYKNLGNMDKSMVVIKDELKDDLQAHEDHVDERFDALEEKVDKIQGPYLTPGLLFLAGIVTVITAAIVALLAVNLSDYDGFAIGMMAFFSGVVLGGLVLFGGFYRGFRGKSN